MNRGNLDKWPKVAKCINLIQWNLICTGWIFTGHEQPAFNQENQDSDWKKVVIVWNGNHAKRNENEFFSKTCSLVLQYIIQFGSHTSHHAQICWNVMQVMQILVKCQNHLNIQKENGSKIQKKHYRGSPIAFTCIMQVIYIIQFTMDNLQASSTNFTPTCQKYLDGTFKSGACKN